MKNGGQQLMNYHRNTMKGEPALFFHYVPVAEWKGARFLHFIFYFCFSAEGGSNREDLPICHRQSRWQPYDFLPTVSAALELEGQPCLKPGKSIDSLPIPILFSLPPEQLTWWGQFTHGGFTVWTGMPQGLIWDSEIHFRVFVLRRQWGRFNIQPCSSKSRGASGKQNPPDLPWCGREK